MNSPTPPSEPPARRRRWVRWLLTALVLPLLLLATAYRPERSAAELEALYTDEASRFGELGGQRIHYRDEGSGPCLLLLHGTASSLHTWDGWVERLRGDFRLLRLDLPGFGLSGPNAEGDYGSERRLAAIDDLRRLAGEERCSLAGNSLGGYLAWRYALAWPEKVDRLILIDAAGAPKPSGTGAPANVEGGTTVLDLVHVPVLNRLLTRLTPRFLVSAGLRDVYGDPDALTAETIDRHYDLLLREGNRRALLEGGLARRAEALEGWGDRLSEIRAPTLLIWGGRDDWIPVLDAATFHDLIPHSELEIFPELGHVPMEEDPPATAAVARRFLLAADDP